MLHECLKDNQWDIVITCHKCGRKLSAKETEYAFNYLKDTTW